jgi:hypothetical protein
MSVTEVKFLQKWWRRRDIVTKHAICLQWFGDESLMNLGGRGFGLSSD